VRITVARSTRRVWPDRNLVRQNLERSSTIETTKQAEVRFHALLTGRIAFVHTEVYEPYEVLGLGSRLARAALDDARARGLVMMPFCRFIAGFIERHLDEYRDLVAPEMIGGDRL
jgi:predicted GNAT family acetyltransferase